MKLEREYYEGTYRKAMSMCDRTGYGTAFVSYRDGAWHCFWRSSEYPYRVKFATLVINGE